MIRVLKFVAFFGSALAAAIFIVGVPVATSPETLTVAAQAFQSDGDALTVTVTLRGVLEVVRMVLLVALAFCVMMFFIRLGEWFRSSSKRRKALREWKKGQS